jgi:hypothetical protein
MENLDNDLKELYRTESEKLEKKEDNIEKEENVVETEEKTAKVEDVENKEKRVEDNKKIEQPINNQPQMPQEPMQNNIELPRGVKTAYKDSWNTLNKDFQQELRRSFEVKDNYIKNLEEKNNLLNKAINTAEIEIQNVVKQTGLPREQVIGNMLSWVSACQVDPDNTLCNALGQGAINLKNPEGFIRFVANKYNLNLNDLINIDPAQANLYDENARLRMYQEAQSKQAEYQKQMQELEEGRRIENSIETFKLNHQEINNELFSSPVFQSQMAYAIEKVKSTEPNNNDLLDIMEKAYRIIEKDYATQSNQENVAINNNPISNVATDNQIKKPITIVKTTGIKSSTPTSRQVQKSYTNKREMEADLEQELKNMYRNNN